MTATPDAYCAAIARTKDAIAALEGGSLSAAGGRHIVRHLMLLRQRAALEEGLARATEEAASVACPQAAGVGLDSSTL